MSFAKAAADLKGLVRGTFRGIEVLKRGVSPRIISANVLGSKGDTPITGDELAARLGLYDTWAYFSVSEANQTHPEPDRSGAAAPPPAKLPTATGPSGGTSPPVAPGPVGGTAAQ